jgi:hypothetical protein
MSSGVVKLKLTEKLVWPVISKFMAQARPSLIVRPCSDGSSLASSAKSRSFFI